MNKAVSIRRINQPLKNMEYFQPDQVLQEIVRNIFLPVKVVFLFAYMNVNLLFIRMFFCLRPYTQEIFIKLTQPETNADAIRTPF